MSIVYSFLSAVLCLVLGWIFAARLGVWSRKGSKPLFWAVFIFYYLSLLPSIYCYPFNLPLVLVGRSQAGGLTQILAITQMCVYPLQIALETVVVFGLCRLSGKAGRLTVREAFALGLTAAGAAAFIFPFGAYLLYRG